MPPHFTTVGVDSDFTRPDELVSSNNVVEMIADKHSNTTVGPILSTKNTTPYVLMAETTLLLHLQQLLDMVSKQLHAKVNRKFSSGCDLGHGQTKRWTKALLTWLEVWLIKWEKRGGSTQKKDEKGQNTLTSFVGTVHTSIAPTQDSFILVTVYVHIQKVKMNAS